MRMYLGTACLTLCLTLPSFAQTPATTPPQQSQPQQPRAGADEGGAGAFIRAAGESGKAEVELATLAQKKATNSRVRAYAERLHRDHTNANKELMTLASAKKVTIPDVPAAKKAVAMRLEKTDAQEFDRAYMTQMVADHREAIALFERGGADSDPQVKAFAQKTLPTLKEHLTEAEAVQKSLGASSATPGRGTSPAPGSPTPPAAPGGRGTAPGPGSTAPGTNPGGGTTPR